MIKTLSFTPTKKELLRLLFILYFKKKWPIYILIFICGIFIHWFGQEDWEFTGMVLIIGSIILPLLVILQFWRFLSHKDNQAFYRTRYFEIDENNLKSVLPDGSTSSVKMANFIRWKLIDKSYLLYMTKTQYFQIPISTFQTPEDLKWFQIHILGKISLPGFL